MKNILTTNSLNKEYLVAPLSSARNTEKAFSEQLEKVAESIRYKVRDCPIILIAGPSGSCKTTTAKMLEAIFDSTGMETHTIALDNYFRTIPEEDYNDIENGKIDLESPDRLNAELLSEHMKKIAKCEPVELPVYDFTTTTSKNSGVILQRKPEEPVIFEGIHALNPNVIRIPQSKRCGIYVSVHTHIQTKNTTMHPLYLRLLRRMIRDRQHRGRSVIKTLSMLSDVERGKNQFIKPFRRYANYEIDTFLSYEPGVYRSILLPELEEALFDGSLSKESRNTLNLICKTLREISPLTTDIISPDSPVREFIGNI